MIGRFVFLLIGQQSGISMSNLQVNAMRSIRLPPIYKMVFWVLCDVSDDKGFSSTYAPLSRLINETCLSRDSVIRALAWLESVNLISANRGNGRLTTYKITVENANLKSIEAEVSRKKLAGTREIKSSKPVDHSNQSTIATSRPQRKQPVDHSVEPVDHSVEPVDAADTNHLFPLIHQEQPSKQRAKAPSEKPASSKFKPPEQNEVVLYFSQLGEIGGEDFYDHFKSNGWKVSGKTPMADWQAAARNWIRRGKKFQAARPQPAVQNHHDFSSYLQDQNIRDVTPTFGAIEHD